MHAPSHPTDDDTSSSLGTGRRAAEVGSPFPLGAHWDGRGTNFSVFSESASRVELCLFEGNDVRTIDLTERTAFCWHVYLPDVRPGQAYGYRVHGDWDPRSGRRANPAKLLLDPYARAIAGDVRWDAAVLPYEPGSDGDAINTADSAPFVPRSLVIDPAFDWEDDAPAGRPLAESFIYEMHVKGFSALNAGVPEPLRGTYAGLAHPASIDYLRALGVTAVELLPVHHFVTESYLIDRGLTNYWGYNSIGFFAPHAAYATAGAAGAVREFKSMVKALHAAGIEVLLDVVYNHTAEGNHLGPMLSFKGLDNQAYYRLSPDDRRYYVDFTGIGNTLDLRHPQTLQLVLDSLRYWVAEMHVDGFRFDLAVALARGERDFDPRGHFLAAVQQDPLLSRVKLIAEPWDVVDGGYQVGNFPVRWAEWNGRYRDTVRDYWRSQPGQIGGLGTRLTGSADLYEDDGRTPTASVNAVVYHDGFTLADLISYNDKHNEANGEENRDGTNDNRSWNLGAEGPTDDPAILALRRRQARNFLATVILSHGVPMILAGDELGRTQRGNNNAYCQDNELSWIDWAAADSDLLAFTRRVVALRRAHGAFQRRKWPALRPRRQVPADVAWFRQDGLTMRQVDWTNPEVRCLCWFVDDRAAGAVPQGQFDRFLVLFNATLNEQTFRLPMPRWGPRWTPVLDTATADGAPANAAPVAARASIPRPGLSLLVLTAPRR